MTEIDICWIFFFFNILYPFTKITANSLDINRLLFLEFCSCCKISLFGLTSRPVVLVCKVHGDSVLSDDEFKVICDGQTDLLMSHPCFHRCICVCMTWHTELHSHWSLLLTSQLETRKLGIICHRTMTGTKSEKKDKARLCSVWGEMKLTYHQVIKNNPSCLLFPRVKSRLLFLTALSSPGGTAVPASCWCLVSRFPFPCRIPSSFIYIVQFFNWITLVYKKK